MPSLELLLRAHPAVGWWLGLWGLLVVVVVVRRRAVDGPGAGRGMRRRLAVDGRAVAVLALGTLAVVALAPPRGGLVPGIARTCDVRAEHLLWPWNWAVQDPRMGLVGLGLLAGAAVARRPGWLAGAAGLPVLLEGMQLLLPSLARACSVPDLLHTWLGMGVGVALGMLGHLAARRLRAGHAVLIGIVVAALAVNAAWARVPAPVDPRSSAPLMGEMAHYPAWDQPAEEDVAWLESGRVPGSGTAYQEMSTVALWDLRLLNFRSETEAGGLPHAGPAEAWGYFWPRDGAFLVAALARTGHQDAAAGLLVDTSELYLDPMYGFDARYLLSGGRVYLDPRRAQVDGCGWMLWAIHETAAVGDVPAEVDDLRDRCTDQLLRATGGGSHLPAPGQDYWERTTYRHLLGASAPVAAGLRLAAADYRALGREDRAAAVGEAAAGVRAEIERHFGPDYLREGTGGGLDAATAMLMPPFDPDPLPGVREAWLAYQEQALRPAGGLAPGSGWKQDGISWTPQVALVAYTAAAAGEVETAHRWLTWLDEHRAPWGSLPEKVDWQGNPAGPAPLGWTSALVVLALDELEGRSDIAVEAAGGRGGVADQMVRAVTGQMMR